MLNLGYMNGWFLLTPEKHTREVFYAKRADLAMLADDWNNFILTKLFLRWVVFSPFERSEDLGADMEIFRMITSGVEEIEAASGIKITHGSMTGLFQVFLSGNEEAKQSGALILTAEEVLIELTRRIGDITNFIDMLVNKYF